MIGTAVKDRHWRRQSRSSPRKSATCAPRSTRSRTSARSSSGFTKECVCFSLSLRDESPLTYVAAPLKKVTEDKGKGPVPPLDSTQDFAFSPSELQADRDRWDTSRTSNVTSSYTPKSDSLAHLLHLASTENGELSSQLSTTQADIEQVSERVRRKLVEQKGKLEDAYADLGEVEARLRAEEERGRRAEEGWEKETRKCRILERMVGEKLAEGATREGPRRDRWTDRSLSD